MEETPTNFKRGNPTTRGLRAWMFLLCGVVLIQLFAGQTDAQRSRSAWQTLSGDAPLVIARGGFSGLFPDSSFNAYTFAKQISVASAALWCDVQLTKDGAGICFPDLKLNNASTVEYVFPNRQKSYPVNGVSKQGLFTIDFSLTDLINVTLIRGIFSRTEKFDGMYSILTVEDVTTQTKPESFWLNIQHDAFYTQQNLSISSFLISASRNVSIDYISSPEVNFFKKISGRFGPNGPSFVFQFLGKEDFEPTTNRTYGSILSNLTFVKTFASGILVPKSYILPLDDKQYLLPPTSLVQDAHKEGLQVYASGFANDVDIAHDYGFDPVTEYLSFVDNGNFSVDGVLSDFPITPSASIDCFSHLGRNATKQVDFLVISKNGASAEYPGCTDLAYDKAIKDGADVIDCSVQMSSDGIPFCSTVEINSYVTGAGIDGIITEFPFTAARYKRNRCLGTKETPIYMAPIEPGTFLQLSSALPPDQAPIPVFTDDDVSAYDRYKRCSQPFRCGDQGDLLYPFWIPDREACGNPDYNLNCSSGFAEITVSSVKFRILKANYTSRIIRLARSDYIDSLCPSSPLNGEIPISALQLATDTDRLTMLYGCQNLSSRIYSSEAYSYVTQFKCNDQKEGVSNYCVVINSSSALFYSRDVTENCTKEVSMPVSGSKLHTLHSDNLKKTLEQGFELELKQDCSLCLDSNGACGYNQTSRRFVCYCDDGNHGQNCSSSGKTSHESSVNTVHKGPLINTVRKVWGSVVGVVMFLVLLSLFLCFLWKREARQRQQNLKSLIPLRHYTYGQVKRITKSFAEVVGRGGFGIVYRGTLSDGRMVAVKVLKDSKGNGEDFTNEVASMSQTSHQNIVSLLGFCSEGSKRAIIYEFLGNGSLDKFISGKSSMNLDWTALYQIALGVARGLEYLHHGCKTRIVHFDIKPQNVLLDDNFCPKVSDFGLAKLCEKKESALSLLDTRGTVGYIAPEMISRVYGSVSHKSDVYSYGMLVLEMIGARNKERAHQDSASNTSSIYFPEWVYRDIELGKSRMLIENEISNEEHELAKKMTLVGLWCIQSSPLDRPPMNRVVEMMEGSLDALEVPPKPALQIPIAPLQESSTLSRDISVYTEE